jgi:hypothetical protein
VRKHARLIRRGGSTDKERRGPPSRGEGRHREERRGEDAEHARPAGEDFLHDFLEIDLDDWTIYGLLEDYIQVLRFMF